MTKEVVLAFASLAIPLAMLVGLLATARGDRFRFDLRTVLFWFVPMAAAIAWILTWDGPLASNRRVMTHKTGLIMLLLDANVVIAAWWRGWFAPRGAVIALCVFGLLFGYLAWHRHERLDAERQRIDVPGLGVQTQR